MTRIHIIFGVTLLCTTLLCMAGLMADDDARWPFDVREDPLTDDALWDLRPLNEDAAGQSGWLQLSKDGMSFELGNGKPVRFWPVTSYAWAPKKKWTLEEMRYHCRSLAKGGVNMIRLHLQIHAHDPKNPDAIHREVYTSLQLPARNPGFTDVFTILREQ